MVTAQPFWVRNRDHVVTGSEIGSGVFIFSVVATAYQRSDAAGSLYEAEVIQPQVVS
jgi:hypothetical protein